MTRMYVFWVCSLLVLLMLAISSSGGVVTADEGTDATVAALQTKVSRQATSIAKQEAKIEQLRTRVAELLIPEFATSSSSTMGGTALGILPPGNPGVLDVVAFAPVGGTIAVLVQNNTDQPVAGVKVSAIATASDGTPYPSSLFPSELKPYVINPGEYGIGSVTFNTLLAGGESLAFTLEGEPLTEPPLATDLVVLSATVENGVISGELINSSGHAMYGPVVLQGLCFDQSGAITGSILGFAKNQYEIDPDEQSAFSVDLVSSVDCSLFIIAGGGTTNGF